MDPDIQRRLRALPSVHSVMSDPALANWASRLPPDALLRIAQSSVDEARSGILGGSTLDPAAIVQRVANRLSEMTDAAGSIVVNGTGVVIHTNLGRSPVSRATADAMAWHAGRYQALELRLDTGERGGRGDEVSQLMGALTGAEQTLVVNNNAAAVLLTLAATTSARDVIVSRGEAVEIGGGFRVPDVLRQSGANLVEVGTTNRTYLRDYEAATTDNTAAYLKVHASNFLISGFTAAASLTDLAALGRLRGVLLIEDVGSGCLLDTRQYGLAYEPTIAESIAAGADVVCASGDKLLGGPQAGLIVGRAEVVKQIAAHPLARAVRADKSCLAGIAATLRHYLLNEAEREIPVWWSISRSPDWLRERAERWQAELGHPFVEVVQTESVVGGGSLPGRTLPSFGIALAVPGTASDELARRLRTGSPAVMPRIIDERVAIDARTVLPDEDTRVVSAVRAALG